PGRRRSRGSRGCNRHWKCGCTSDLPPSSLSGRAQYRNTGKEWPIEYNGMLISKFYGTFRVLSVSCVQITRINGNHACIRNVWVPSSSENEATGKTAFPETVPE